MGRRKIMRQKLDSARNRINEALMYLMEVHKAFSEFPEHYKKYIEMIEAISLLLIECERLIEKLQDAI